MPSETLVHDFGVNTQNNLFYPAGTLPFTGRQISETNSAPRSIFEARREDVINDGIYDLDYLSNIIRVMKLRRVRQAVG
jgi:hypothetical protein